MSQTIPQATAQNTIQIPQTVRELDEAVKKFQTTDLHGDALYQQWQAIRDAALQQSQLESAQLESETSEVPGTDSY